MEESWKLIDLDGTCFTAPRLHHPSISVVSTVGAIIREKKVRRQKRLFTSKAPCLSLSDHSRHACRQPPLRFRPRGISIAGRCASRSMLQMPLEKILYSAWFE